MIKRILIDLFLSFVLLPLIVPILLYLIGLSFGYNVLQIKPWYTFWSFFQIHWGGMIAYCSIFVLVFVFGIYDCIIVFYFKSKNRAMSLGLKLLIFFILLSSLFFLSHQVFFFDMGNNFYYFKILLLLIFTSISMVILHYLLIDKKFETLSEKY